MNSLLNKQITEVKTCDKREEILNIVMKHCLRGMDKTESDNYISVAMKKYSEIAIQEFANSITNELNPTDEIEAEIIDLIENLLLKQMS